MRFFPRSIVWRIVPALLLLTATRAAAVTFVVEAEQLKLPGGWQLVNMTRDDNVRKYVLAGPQAKDAPLAGAVEIPHAGKWRVWVRSKDFPEDRPGTRKFSVRLGEKRSETIFGRHNRADNGGWAWEDGGFFELPAGPALVAIGDEVTQSARCDTLVLTDNPTYVPEGVPWKLQKQPAQIAKLTLTEESKRGFLPAPLHEVEEKPVATLENSAVRFAFHAAKTDAGAAISMRAATRDAERWVPLDGGDSESYRVLFRPAGSDPKIVSRRVNPEWDTTLSPVVEARCGGMTVRTRLGIVTAPWASARCFPLRPVSARQRDANTVELNFPAVEAGQLTATWRLPEGKAAAEIELNFIPSKPGVFSLGYHAPLEAQPETTDFLLLPFLYQGRRFPEQPTMLLSALTPTPLALVNRGGVSCALVAEPGDIPFEWPTETNPRYALGLRNEMGAAQPLLYTPVLGLPGSSSDGAPLRGRLRLWLQRGDWYVAYRGVVDEVFGLTDYRRPTTASLSDAALNLVDYIRNEPASGWNTRAKGPWNIESRNTVSQVSPLTYFSLYLLTGDEDLYRRFARPSLEYLLSRNGPHFAAEREIWDNYYKHQPMHGPGPFFGASTFAAAFAMTQWTGAAFGGLCLDEHGAARETHGNGHTQHFADLVALYRLTGERRWLEAATTAADKYISANITTLPTRDLGSMPFGNVSFTPDWEGLLHVYEASGEKRFLAAATEGARWHLTNLWTQPRVPAGEMTIHPGGVYDADRHVWWFGDRLFRRGIYDGPAAWEAPYPPPPRLPEHRIPAWQPSQVGLGYEQPATYNRHGPQANILMSTWAPSLLRLAAQSGDDAFRVAARNAMIGRFANYPGYYLDGFTDEYQRPDYPVTGPDVTSLYVHHVPPFTASVLDFQFTDAEVRSQGAVTFPSVRQCGYVWFDSRLFGHAPGSVYGQPAWPWLHRTAVTVDTVNVDRVLAEGDGKFHVVLLNQVHERQIVRVKFDEKTLGRSLAGATVEMRADNQPATTLPLEAGVAELALPPLGIAALTLSGVKIEVPTHRLAPPGTFSLPTATSLPRRAPIAGTKLEAVGTMFEVPPHTWRDLYVYVTAGLDDCTGARLRYRIGDGAEQRLESTSFPWEFSVRLEEMRAPVTWAMDVKLPDGQWLTANPGD